MKTLPRTLMILTLSTLALIATNLMGAESAAKTDTKPGLLGGKLCQAIVGGGGEIVELSFSRIENHLKQFIGHKNPTKTQMIEYLNKNKNKMGCGEGRHYMHLAVEKGRGNEIFRKLFMGKLKSGRGNPIVDVNAVCDCGPKGEQETVLDYIERFISRYEQKGTEYSGVVRKAKSLKKTLLKKFNAKRFNELPEAERQAYMK